MATDSLNDVEARMLIIEPGVKQVRAENSILTSIFNLANLHNDYILHIMSYELICAINIVAIALIL